MDKKRRSFTCCLLVILLLSGFLGGCSTNSIERNYQDWPNRGLFVLLPDPPSNKCVVVTESDERIYANVFDVSDEDFANYIESCKQAGFSIVEVENSIVFDAHNVDGYSLSTVFASSSKELSIFLDVPTDENASDNAETGTDASTSADEVESTLPSEEAQDTELTSTEPTEEEIIETEISEDNDFQVPSQEENPTESTVQDNLPTQEQLQVINGTVLFGKYEQDNDFTNGLESIEWIVLDVVDGKALLLSKFALDKQPYNDTEDAFAETTWATCTLRNWLNTDFYGLAFSDDEKPLIISTQLDNSNADGWGVAGGKDTNDKVFLLSYGEGRHYLYNNDNMIAIATKYTKSLNPFLTRNGATEWWLRSPAQALNGAATGQIYGGGEWKEYAFCNFENATVRPAIWVEISGFPEN